MNYFTLTSSSNILPGKSLLEKLEKNNKLLFADYGAWAQTLLSAKTDENIISILFLKDFVDFIDDKGLNEKLDLIEKIFKERLNRDKGFTLLLFSSQFENNILDTTKKNFSFNKSITNFFLKMFELSNEYKNFIFCNVDLIFSKFGYDNCFDNRNWYFFKMLFVIKRT